MKTNNPKAKIFIWKFISIFHCTIYHYQKAKKKVLKLLRVLIDRVLFGFHSDRILFRFLSDKAILKVLINMVLFESSVIDSSSGGLSSRFFSLGSSVLFFRYAATFLSKRATTFI